MCAENRFSLLLFCVIGVCLTVLYGFLFVSLWPYRVWVGLSLLAVVVFVVVLQSVVSARGKLTEQALRRSRYHYTEEIPLDGVGEPVYWPQDAQTNPHRAAGSQTYYQPNGMETKQESLYRW